MSQPPENWRWQWDSSQNYVPGDTVFHNGSAWIAVANSTAQEPVDTDATYWNLLAQRGDDGLPGAPAPANPVITLTAAPATSFAAGGTYLLLADFSASGGAFADARYTSWFPGLSGTIVIEENKALWTPTQAAWTLWTPPPGYGAPPPSSPTLSPALAGAPWSGAAPQGVATTWTITRIA
ncbi:MAG: hypothetical protein JO250_12390 [Armatimonadetes bacterium]|nr:hypothetical protein [Armatimonadota bacterium]